MSPPFPLSFLVWLFGGCVRKPRRAAAHMKRKLLGRPRVTVKAEGEWAVLGERCVPLGQVTLCAGAGGA